MKLQKCTISIHPVVAQLNPALLAKLMTWDIHCLPLKTYKQYPNKEGYLSDEQGIKCTLYFRKKFSKPALHTANQIKYPTGVFIHLCNTMDNPCLIQNGHSSDYAVWLYDWEDIHSMILEAVEETMKVLNRGKEIDQLIQLI